MFGISRRRFLKNTLAIAGTCLQYPIWASIAEKEKVNPITSPIRDSMKRVSKCCFAWLNPSENYRPTGGYEVAHDTGRWWDAMLRYESATEDRIPSDIEKYMMKNLHEMTDNPAGLLMNMFEPLEAQQINLHNIRETMLTYTALVKYRKDDWARKQGKKLVSTLTRLLNPDGQLDYSRLKSLMGDRKINPDPLMCPQAPTGEWFDSTGTTGRAIEAILCFAEVTGDEESLQLAKRLAEVHLHMIMDPSGKVCPKLLHPEHVGHNHSYCGTLRGLLLYGLMQNEQKYVDAIIKTYRNGLWGTTISYSGWTPHDLGKLRFPNEDGDPVGEHGSCADVMLLSLWLGLRAGQVDLFDDVERLIRARLLPSQIKDPENPRNDGAWGVYGHPFGYGSILDVFAAVLHALVEVDAHIISVLPDGTCSINLHFTCDTPNASLIVRKEDVATVSITPKRNSRLRIRVPSWSPKESVKVSMNSTELTPQWEGNWIVFDSANISVGQTIQIKYELPKKETTEIMPVSKKSFKLFWRGDEVIESDPPVPIYS